jgi:hypothetical protein
LSEHQGHSAAGKINEIEKIQTTCSEAHLASYLIDIKGLFLGVKRKKLEADRSLITSDEVKKRVSRNRSKKYNTRK